MTDITGKINEPVKMTATGNLIEWIQFDPQVNLKIALDKKSASFTPSENKTYRFSVIEDGVSRDINVLVGTSPPPVHTCPSGQHWDEAQQKCVNDIPNPTGTLWDSNTDGKWNNGNPRVITVKQGGQKPDDKSIFVAASGSPKLVVDGDGVAHLVGGTGIFDNLSLKLRSRHQEGSACENRFGGYGAAIDRSTIDMKTETCHNIHVNSANKSHGVSIKNNEWHNIAFECKGSNPVLFECWVDGASKMKHSDNNPPPGADKAILAKNSYFWIRGNNSDHPRIYVMAINNDAKLSMDFMFENSNSIALKNVQLIAV